MKKYFCVSDIHSFYTPLKTALDNAGFDINNKDHILIVCGDIFDRGYETIEVYKFLKSIPKKRRIMIKGNHEELYLELLEKDFPESHDFHNGTVNTFCDIANLGYDDRYLKYIYYTSSEEEEANNFWLKIKNKVKKSSITKWLMSDEWINYYEIKNKIFVHSFIPLNLDEKGDVTYNPDWRNLDSKDKTWWRARWCCPWKLLNSNLFDNEKIKGNTLVCGHWHASDFRLYMNKESLNSDNPLDLLRNLKCEDNTTYYGDHVIALDACTAVTGFINVFVFE